MIKEGSSDSLVMVHKAVFVVPRLQARVEGVWLSHASGLFFVTMWDLEGFFFFPLDMGIRVSLSPSSEGLGVGFSQGWGF